ncbi:MAG: SGNH/GDSL hydrolase family protein [Clostridiaceae bacterium]|nr:SGNH/GDSL hydrolase family protein [Clostridiaceae bacterium]
MSIPSNKAYLLDIVEELNKYWPENRTINIVSHGHSVPAGYFATPVVDTLNAYPHLLHRELKKKYPYAVVNVIVTAIGGESSCKGLQRFEREVLCFRPDVITIDYGLNDRRIGLEAARESWSGMIRKSLELGIKVLLLTPTMDKRGFRDETAEGWVILKKHCEQIRLLADEFGVGLVDSFKAFEEYIDNIGSIEELMSFDNHPNRRGHELVAREIMKWF